MDAVGAFEALRLVKALGERGDVNDEEALSRFMDLVTMRGDFTSGLSFWQNVYKLWLVYYARALDTDFQVTLRKFTSAFNEEHQEEGYSVSFRGRGPMTYEQLRDAEARLPARDAGAPVPGHQSPDRRLAAAGVLDVIGCSLVASGPACAVALVRSFQQANAENGRWGTKLELLHFQSGFHPSANPVDGIRDLTLHVLLRGGERAANRTGPKGHTGIVGEVKIVLPQFLAVQESLKPLSAYLENEFKQPPALLS
jgi:hypothetical protein